LIARLVGTVVAVEPDAIVVDVSGVGYAVSVPGRVAVGARLEGGIVLWVHTAVREDAITLYGFESTTDKAAFQTLIGVSGIGPKLALATLSALTVPDLARAVEGNDLRTLSGIPGVGRKTAERLVLELRGKLAWSPASAATPAQAAAPDDPLPLALAQLGYKKSEIDMAVARLAEAGLAAAPLSERVAAALRTFAGSGRSGAPRPG